MYADAKAVLEEAYIYVSGIYDPEHPQVLETASKLIDILAMAVDFYDAERFARICYEAFTRPPLDPESFEACNAAISLSRATCNLITTDGPEGGDIEEAETLAKEAVRIASNLGGYFVSDLRIAQKRAFSTLVDVKLIKKDFTDETKKMLENYLSDSIRYEGMDGEGTGSANSHLGRFYSEFVQSMPCDDTNCRNLQLSRAYYTEALRIITKCYGPDHPLTKEIASKLTKVSIIFQLIVERSST
jgi:hypothetical protein